jgi:transposase InsO family protein
VAVDFFTVPTLSFRVLFVFVVLAHHRQRHIHFNVTARPSAEWATQQIVQAFPWDTAPRYLIRDRDSVYGEDFRQRVEAMGIHEVLTAPRSPWQNAYAERLVGRYGANAWTTSWIKLQTAAVTTDEQRFRITHPFHPLRDQTLICVASKQRVAGERQFMIRGADGSLCLVPANWTDFLPPDPYLLIGEGRSYFRVEDLVALADILRRIES